MSEADLIHNGLYIILFVRDQTPKPDDFHWGLYTHNNTGKDGTKFHIKGREGHWMADHGVTKGVFKSFLLVGLIRIANIPTELESHAEGLIRSYDHKLNEMGITCRSWLFEVLKLLQTPVNNLTILKCKDLGALEQEAKEWGNQHAIDTVDNVQPRALHTSTLCGI